MSVSETEQNERNMKQQKITIKKLNLKFTNDLTVSSSLWMIWRLFDLKAHAGTRKIARNKQKKMNYFICIVCLMTGRCTRLIFFFFFLSSSRIFRCHNCRRTFRKQKWLKQTKCHSFSLHFRQANLQRNKLSIELIQRVIFVTRARNNVEKKCVSLRLSLFSLRPWFIFQSIDLQDDKPSMNAKCQLK